MESLTANIEDVRVLNVHKTRSGIFRTHETSHCDTFGAFVGGGFLHGIEHWI